VRWYCSLSSFDGVTQHFLPAHFAPPDFALRLARKDVSLAVEVGREFNVPMRLANLTLEELTEAFNRGWGQRDSRVAMLLQEERAGVNVQVPQERIQEILDSDRSGA
jgi:3-hydroxyisobutyrate dehydrogenase-like beta-hydroxyacid dehydrogenase